MPQRVTTDAPALPAKKWPVSLGWYARDDNSTARTQSSAEARRGARGRRHTGLRFKKANEIQAKQTRERNKANCCGRAKRGSFSGAQVDLPIRTASSTVGEESQPVGFVSCDVCRIARDTRSRTGRDDLGVFWIEPVMWVTASRARAHHSGHAIPHESRAQDMPRERGHRTHSQHSHAKVEISACASSDRATNLDNRRPTTNEQACILQRSRSGLGVDILGVHGGRYEAESALRDIRPRLAKTAQIARWLRYGCGPCASRSTGLGTSTPQETP